MISGAIQFDPVGVAAAFGAGMLSFLSPCVLPLVPGYMSMVSGVSVGGLASQSSKALVGTISWFIGGFTLVFVGLGAAASGLGSVLRDNQALLTTIAGWLTVLVGAAIATGYLPRLLSGERRFHYVTPNVGGPASGLMGMAFAFGWTPCIGPVLGAVLALAASRSSVAGGIVLLVAYSLGLGVPFLAAGVAWGRALSLFGWVKRHSRAVAAVSGAVLIGWGAVLLLGDLHFMSSFFSNLMNSVGLNRLTVS